MYSIIRDMLENNRCGSENFPVSEEQKKIAKNLFDYEEKIKKFLPEGESEKIIWEYSCLQGELAGEAERTDFTEGFKIGLLIGAEVFFGTKK